MDFPVWYNNADTPQCSSSCKNVLVNRVNERAVEIKQDCGIMRSFSLHLIASELSDQDPSISELVLQMPSDTDRSLDENCVDNV